MTEATTCEHGVNTYEKYCYPCAAAASEGTPPAATLKPKDEDAPDPFQRAWKQHLHDHSIEVLNSCSGVGVHAMKQVSRRAFEAGSIPPEHVQDLRAEHEALRRTLLQTLIKLGVIDQDSSAVPWGAVEVLQFTGLWLSNAMPWVKQGRTHRQLGAAIGQLEQKVGYQGAKLDELASLMERVTKLEEQVGSEP